LLLVFVVYVVVVGVHTIEYKQPYTLTQSIYYGCYLRLHILRSGLHSTQIHTCAGTDLRFKNFCAVFFWYII